MTFGPFSDIRNRYPEYSRRRYFIEVFAGLVVECPESSELPIFTGEPREYAAFDIGEIGGE